MWRRKLIQKIPSKQTKKQTNKEQRAENKRFKALLNRNTGDTENAVNPLRTINSKQGDKKN